MSKYEVSKWHLCEVLDDEVELTTDCETGEQAFWTCGECGATIASDGVLREFWDNFAGDLSTEWV